MKLSLIFNYKQAIVTIFVFGMVIFCSSGISRAQNIDLPSPHGKGTIEQLRQSGRYDSLMEAYTKAMGAGLQTAGNPAPEATGQATKLFAPDGGSGDNFGFSVAIQGDTAVIGARDQDIGPNDSQGAVYVFVRNGTSWSMEQKLTAPDGAPYDRFGYSVAVNGNNIVVGATFDDIGANEDQGSVYYFVKSGNTWVQIQKLVAADGVADAFFGYSVAMSGFTLVVGANHDEINGFNRQGSIYVYVGAGAWSLQEKITAFDGATDDRFGGSVSIDGNILVAGSHFDNIDANADQGSAYVYVRNGTSWSPLVKLLAPDGAAGDHFGVGVAISSNTVVVGSYFDDIGTNSSQGSAYVFLVSPTTWSFQQKLTAADGTSSDVFGSIVGIDGNTIVVGADGRNVGTHDNQGAAYVFKRSGTSWTQQARLIAADGAASDRFGSSMAVSGAYVVIGAPFDFIGATTDQGSAYIFRQLGSFWSQEALKVAPSGDTDTGFATGVSISGDTAIVGAPNQGVGANREQGAAYIFVRNGASWTLQAQLAASDGAALDFFGNSVSIYGDFAIVGCPNDDVGTNGNQGSAYIFVRNGTTWSQYRKLTASDGAAGDEFGISVSANGESVIIGARRVMGGNGNTGAAYVFFKFETEWIQQAKLIDEFGGAGDSFGQSVAISEDTAIVSASGKNVGGSPGRGAAFIFTRNGTVWSSPLQLTADDGEANDNFGYSVAIDDRTAVVTAMFDDVGTNINQGSAYVYFRNTANSWQFQQKLTATDGAAGDYFGTSVAVDGDALVIGAHQDDIGASTDQGSAYVFERLGAIWTQKQRPIAAGGAAGDIFGFSVAISGDKIVIGVPYSDLSVFQPFARDLQSAPEVSGQGAAYFFINSPGTPTAAHVSIGGRVLSLEGQGIGNAIVYLVDQSGGVRTTRSSSLGYYRFDDVPLGQTIFLHAISKRFVFPVRIVNVEDELTGFDLIASP